VPTSYDARPRSAAQAEEGSDRHNALVAADNPGITRVRARRDCRHSTTIVKPMSGATATVSSHDLYWIPRLRARRPGAGARRASGPGDLVTFKVHLGVIDLAAHGDLCDRQLRGAVAGGLRVAIPLIHSRRHLTLVAI